MTKVKCLVASFLLLSFIAKANPVDKNTAATVAMHCYNQSYHASAGMITLVYTERSSDGQSIYYVFNVSKGGFVIVSAEDAGYPIIGYSNSGQYVIPTDNSNLGFWMNQRKKEIVAMRAANVQANSDIKATWSAYINNTTRNTHQSMSAVAPLTNITWDQSPYYNEYCPGGSVTGCVATAMAQIMRYWGYPNAGTGNSCYYDETAYGYTENYGQLCATYDTSNYIWSEMPHTPLTSINHQVAKLIYDCGVSVAMNYSPTESGSYVTGPNPSAQYSYVNYFGYNAATIQAVMQSHYTASAWLSLMENELNNKRLIQYEGTDPNNGGHSWLCEGYNASGDLYMNWGWSGYDNGYYAPANLDPSSYSFTEYIGALIGIEPPSGLGVASETAQTTTTKVYPNPSSGVVTIELNTLTGNPQIAIYNVLGQQVYSSKITDTKTTLNLGTQPKGLYLYRVMNENGNPVSTGRLVIQ